MDKKSIVLLTGIGVAVFVGVLALGLLFLAPTSNAKPNAPAQAVAPKIVATQVAPVSAPTVAVNAPAPTTAPAVAANAPAPTTAPSGGMGRGRGMAPGQEPGGLVAMAADGKTTIPAPAGSNLAANMATQTVRDLNITIALTPYPPVSFQTGTFDVTLKDTAGKAVTDAQISLDLTMPGMWMPPSKPDAKHLGDGKYQASARWTMRGLWRIETIITRGSQKYSAFFDVWL